MEEQIQRLTTINESVRKTLGASQARISVLAKEKAELQTELRMLKRTTSVSEVQTGQDENVEEEGFEDSENELEDQNSADEGEEAEEEKNLNSDQKSEEILDLSNVKPPPKPPRVKIELDAEENGDKLNSNESGVGNGDENGKDDLKENELNGKDKGEEHEDDWEFVGGKPKTSYSREKSEEQKNERNEDNQSRKEKEKKDPNRPRYTKAEMLEILIERNNLKERVFALEDELKIYKPR